MTDKENNPKIVDMGTTKSSVFIKNDHQILAECISLLAENLQDLWAELNYTIPRQRIETEIRKLQQIKKLLNK